MKFVQMISVAIIGIFLIPVSLASNVEQKSSGESAVIEFLLDIQKRSLRKSIDFCQNNEPKINSAFLKYLADYSKGTESGLNKIGKKESIEIFPDGEEKILFLKMQDKQGVITLQQISSNPVQGCKELFEILSHSSAEAAEKKLLAIYDDYLKKREKYCKKIPRPDNCA